MHPSENPFAHVTNPDSLSPEERDAYFWFWAKRTPEERISEVNRLNRAKWGDEVFDRGIDKTRIEVVNMETGEVRIIKFDK
jgi:hypothetical protein